MKWIPPVSPWWMYRWLRDVEPSRGFFRAAWHTIPAWIALWRWAASPEGYNGDYEDVTWGENRPVESQPGDS